MEKSFQVLLIFVETPQIQGQQTTKKSKRANLFCPIISNTTQKLNQKSLPPHRICKGKNVSTNTTKQQMDIDQAMAIHFEEEILMDILTRLPVRSLLRFKCVSKFWKTLISDPYFKMKHLSHAKNNQNSQKILISHYFPEDNILSFRCCPLTSVQLVEDVQDLDFPSSSKSGYCTHHCGYNGLVVIRVIDNAGDKHSFMLWNPSTRESIVLPDPEFPQEESCFGLGYDSASGNYKILKIHTGIGGCKSPGEILTLNIGSWRKIDKHPRGISLVRSGMHSLAFVHEAFHRIGTSSNYSVVSFIISNEVYGEIPLPEQILCSRRIISFGLSVLEGMLCVHSSSFHQGNKTFKLWLLKDYDVKESWNALITIEDPNICIIVPKYRFADGEVLFWCYHAQCGGHEFRTSSGPFAFWPQGGVQHGIAFTESLISPKSLFY